MNLYVFPFPFSLIHLPPSLYTIFRPSLYTTFLLAHLPHAVLCLALSDSPVSGIARIFWQHPLNSFDVGELKSNSSALCISLSLSSAPAVRTTRSPQQQTHHPSQSPPAFSSSATSPSLRSANLNDQNEINNETEEPGAPVVKVE